jgi:lipoprotein-releasing system permease protein
VASIALGVIVMLISFSVLEGFRNTIYERIFSFGAHIQVTKYELNDSFDKPPISANVDFDTLHNKEISHIQKFIHIPGLVITKQEVQGGLFKGIDKDFAIDKFKGNIVEGSLFEFPDTSYSSSVLISKTMRDRLNLHIGDSTVMFFWYQNKPKFRKLAITGIYETGLEEFDQHLLIGDIRMARNINQWNDTLVGGYEIFIKNFDKLDQVAENVQEAISYDLYADTITNMYLQIFDWLYLVNNNVIIFLVLILGVVCFNMVSTVFIIIMERTNTIGVLKALGASNGQIRSIFIFNGIRIILQGLLWGNVIGLGICYLQYKFKIMPLNAQYYYMDAVPIDWNWGIIIGLNALTFLIISLVLTIPVVIISRMNPVKSIRFS